MKQFVQVLHHHFKLLKFLNSFQATEGIPNKTGIALFGIGRAGTNHFENLLQHKLVDLHYVVDESADRLETVRNQNSSLLSTHFISTKEYDKVFQDSRVQAVMITTPTRTHRDLVLKSLNHGKAVFCEKPIAAHLEDVLACYELSKKVQRPLFCAMNRRWDPAYASAVQKVRNKEIGKLVLVKTVSRDPPMADFSYLKTSDGVFHDSVIHDIDLICWIVGEYPTKVFAMGVAHAPEINGMGDYDAVSVQLMFPSGCVGMIDMNRLAKYGYDQRLELMGDEGMIMCGHQKPTEIEALKPQGFQSPGIHQGFVSRYEQSFKGEVDHFLEVVNSKGAEKLIVTGNDVISATKIATACKLSAQTGKCVEIDCSHLEK